MGVLPVNKARLVAQLLVKRFMAEGSISVVPQRLGSAEEGMQLAAAKNKPALWKETEAFAGVAVQAVGHEEGREKPGVVVYATKGSARAFKSLPKAIDDVPVGVKNIGLVSVHPDKPAKATGEPNVYVRK